MGADEGDGLKVVRNNGSVITLVRTSPFEISFFCPCKVENRIPLCIIELVFLFTLKSQ